MQTFVNPESSSFSIFRLEHYFPISLESCKIQARDEVAEYNKEIIESKLKLIYSLEHLKVSNTNGPPTGLNPSDLESIKKKLDNVSESTIRNNKIISLLSEITSQESTPLIDIVDAAPPIRKIHYFILQIQKFPILILHNITI